MNIRRSRNLLLVLIILWTAFVTIVIPRFAQHRAEDDFNRAVRACTNNFQASPDVDEAAERSCMTRAEGIYVIRRTSNSHILAHNTWPSLLILCLGLPSLVYLVAFAVVVLTRRLRRPNSPPPLRNLRA